MSAHIDLTSQADVYSDAPQSTTGKTGSTTGRYAIRLTVEHSPMALSRVFGLIGSVSMVPALSRTSKEGDEVIDVFLEIMSADAHKLDLLCRKLHQLTETVSLQVTSSSTSD
ncbi:MAG: hypothetical protein WD005_03425 [Haliea sp.]